MILGGQCKYLLVFACMEGVTADLAVYLAFKQFPTVFSLWTPRRNIFRRLTTQSRRLYIEKLLERVYAGAAVLR